MYKFDRRQMFTLSQGMYQVQEGIFIKQRSVIDETLQPNGNYNNIAVFSDGDYYNSNKDNQDYIRLFCLEPCIIARVKEVSSSQLIQQYNEIEELNYIQTFPEGCTRQKVYLFLQWAEKKNIMHLLTQSLIAGFCGVTHPTIQRHLTEMRKLGLIDFNNKAIIN